MRIEKCEIIIVLYAPCPMLYAWCLVSTCPEPVEWVEGVPSLPARCWQIAARWILTVAELTVEVDPYPG